MFGNGWKLYLSMLGFGLKLIYINKGGLNSKMEGHKTQNQITVNHFTYME